MKAKLIPVLLLLALSLYGKEVPRDVAEKAATQFILNRNVSGLKSTLPALALVDLQGPHPFSRSSHKSAANEPALLYLFSINEDEGFIVVSGDDMAIPILGYAFDVPVSENELPDNFRKWMEGYRQQIRALRNSPARENGSEELWSALLNGGRLKGSEEELAVAPLLQTTWSQRPWFNELCPYDEEAEERAVVGCVATAMAQIMKYWEHPAQGAGFHSYEHERFGILSANFGTTSYDWAAMPNNVSSSNDAVATLSYHCGVAVDMGYDVAENGGSGAYVISSRSPVENCAEFAFREYFDYDPDLQGVAREYYSDEQWIQLLKTELDAGRPIEYAGFGNGGGHAFVCDGYDNNDFFHMNWGWGGYYDGYFAIDALDPEGLGTGGGSGGFNSGHQAIIGLQPSDGGSGGGGTGSESYELRLYDELTISENPLYFLDPYSFQTDIANYGDASFSGDLCVAVFDDEGNFIEFAKVHEGANLDPLTYFEDVDFSNDEGSLEMLPGDYFAAAFARETDGNWQVIGDGEYNNLLTFEVYHSSDIELYSEFLISSGTSITQHEAFTVTANVLNNGSSTFTGTLSVTLFDMEGEWTADVQDIAGKTLENGYYFEDLVFSNSGLNIEAGTYLMALMHKPDGGEWTLSGSTHERNPVKVIIKEAPLEADLYEDNDDPNDSYVLQAVFSEDAALFHTEGSNIHLGTDMDYYKLELETGYNYTLIPRVHDSYHADNGLTYSNDVLWSYYLADEWSDTYDDVISTPLLMENGGSIWFGVAPYFEGETGTYLLEIEVSRVSTSAVEMESQPGIRVYPNPTDELLHIEGNPTIERVLLFDTGGRLLSTYPHFENATSIDISDLPEGVYYIHVWQSESKSIHKIVKQ